MLTLEDLSGEAKSLAELIGIDAYRTMVRTYGGTSHLYIHKPDQLLIPIRDKLIRKEFDGANIYDLARKWGYSDVYIRQIVKERAKEIRLTPPDGQMSLW